MSLRVLFELQWRLKLLAAGLAGEWPAPGQLLAVLLHVGSQLALQSELIPTLGADEVLEGKVALSPAGYTGRIHYPEPRHVQPDLPAQALLGSRHIPSGPNYEWRKLISLLAEKQRNMGEWINRIFKRPLKLDMSFLKVRLVTNSPQRPGQGKTRLRGRF